LIVNIEVTPPDINPIVKAVPTKNPMGSGTVLFIRKFKLCFLLRFCDPRQRKKISNIAETIFRVKSCNLNNI
tara:strand:+ start:272 stop:487 length:216 start_codon:yes stop_codon:yes gene_type:complete